jgi:hypothetical protein
MIRGHCYGYIRLALTILEDAGPPPVDEGRIAALEKQVAAKDARSLNFRLR